MKSIETMFPSRIWERGRDYYRKGYVKNVEIFNEYVSARVYGSKVYHIEIHYIKNAITEMYCDCPHAESGNNCKHMAALLFKMESLGLINTSAAINRQNEIHNLNEWQQIIEQHVHGRQWITIPQNRHFEDALNVILKKDIRSLAKNNCDAILEHIDQMVKALNQVSEGIIISDVMDHLALFFQKLKQISLQEKGRKWAQRQCLETKRMDVLEFFIRHAFSADQQGLKEIDQMIEKAQHNDQFYVVQTCIAFEIKLMKQLQYSEQAILDFLNPFENYEFVLEYKISYYLKNKIYDQAKKRLMMYAKVPNLSREKRENIQLQLIEIAIVEKDYESCFRFIKERLNNPHMEFPISQTDYLRNAFASTQEWKQGLWAHGEDWKQQVPYYRLLKFYLLLEEYDCFYDLIIERFDLDNLVENSEVLMKYDASMFHLVFFQLIKQEMQEANKAVEYAKILNFLKYYKDIAKNQQVLDEIVIYAREHYQKKSVLMKYLMRLY